MVLERLNRNAKALDSTDATVSAPRYNFLEENVPVEESGCEALLNQGGNTFIQRPCLRKQQGRFLFGN